MNQYLDWKLSEIQTMVLKKKPSADIIHELQHSLRRAGIVLLDHG